MSDSEYEYQYEQQDQDGLTQVITSAFDELNLLNVQQTHHAKGISIRVMEPNIEVTVTLSEMPIETLKSLALPPTASFVINYLFLEGMIPNVNIIGADEMSAPGKSAILIAAEKLGKIFFSSMYHNIPHGLKLREIWGKDFVFKDTTDDYSNMIKELLCSDHAVIKIPLMVISEQSTARAGSGSSSSQSRASADMKGGVLIRDQVTKKFTDGLYNYPYQTYDTVRDPDKSRTIAEICNMEYLNYEHFGIYYCKTLSYYLKNISAYCVNCTSLLNVKLPYLTSCNKTICRYQFRTLGVGVNLYNLLRGNPEVADFQLSLFYHFLQGDRPELNLPATIGDLDPSRLLDILKILPSVNKLVTESSDDLALTNLLNKVFKETETAEVKFILVWILQSTLLGFDDEFDQLEARYGVRKNTIESSYKVYQYDAEKINKFRKEVIPLGTDQMMTGFHGSRPNAWHNILANGLLSLSRSKYMSVGALYGDGVYIGTRIHTSLIYSHKFQKDMDRPNADNPLANKHLMLVNLIAGPEKFYNPTSTYIVIPPGQEHRIMPVRIMIMK